MTNPDRSKWIAQTSFQDRVALEKVNLDSNIIKLGLFLGSDTFNGLPVEDKTLLERQHGVMSEYSEILGLRIARFGAESGTLHVEQA